MVTKTVGKGSDYLLATRDANKEVLDGSQHYTVTLPPNAPVEKFWSFMIYDNQTRSMLETDQKSAGIDGLSQDIKKNSDGSITIHFRLMHLKEWKITGFKRRKVKVLISSSACIRRQKSGLIIHGNQVILLR